MNRHSCDTYAAGPSSHRGRSALGFRAARLRDLVRCIRNRSLMNSQSLHDRCTTLLLPSHNRSNCREIPMMSSFSVRRAVRRALFAASIAFGALPGSQVFAQTAPASDTGELEEVIVTGSLIRRTDAET